MRWSLGPTDLKAQLAAEIGQPGQRGIGGEHGLHARQRAENLKALHKRAINVVHFIVKAVQGLDQMKFPARSEKMGGGQNAPGQAAFIR